MAAQIGLGADIIMAFDECTEFPADRARARASMEMTARWAARSKEYFEDHKHEVPWSTASATGHVGTAADCPAEQSSAAAPANSLEHPNFGSATQSQQTQSLFGIVQGGMDRELRKESAERTLEIGL